MKRDPLTDEELDELDRFLAEAEGLEEAMDVSMLDGYFAALMSGPKTILPSEWMRWVWDTRHGVAGPVFAGTEQAQRILELLMRHGNAVTTTLLHAPEQYEPLILQRAGDDDEPVPILDEWCAGFMKGVGLDPEGWLPVTAGHPEWMSTIILYGTEEGWEQLERRADPIGEHRMRAAGLADTVRRIHALFLEHRKARAGSSWAPQPPRDPARNPGKVGRNDPCPCGSGRKYKHCHGAN